MISSTNWQKLTVFEREVYYLKQIDADEKVIEYFQKEINKLRGLIDEY
jgi:hypothetical protein